jgi:probable HAF family extracellular repeat protein
MGLLASAALYGQGPSYTVTDLGPVGGPPGQPFVIKNNGLIVGGAAVSDTSWHATLWFSGIQFDIAGNGFGGSSMGFGINEKGQVVGEAETSNPDPNGEDFCGFGTRRVCLPFVWQGTMSPLPLLKDANGGTGINGVANAINNRGQIVGIAETTERDSTCPPLDPSQGQYQQFKFKPAMWHNGTVHALPTVANDPDGIVFAINDSGQAVGATGTCTSFQANGDLTYLYGLHVTLWDNDTVTDLGNLGGIMPGGGNSAININNRGQVIGGSGASDGSFYGFLWSKELGKMQNLGAIAGDVASVALGINDKGDITGISFDPDFVPRAFVRPDGGAMADLNSLVPADTPLYLFDACSINSRGEIIGIGIDANGDAHGFLASPANGASGSAAATSAARALEFDHARKLLRQRIGSRPFGSRPVARR